MRELAPTRGRGAAQAVRMWLTQQDERAAARACAQAILPPQTCNPFPEPA